jgi:hypothetical protein
MPIGSVPRSLADLLVVFRPCFTAPTFGTFTAMVAGFVAQSGLRTVTGMLAGARLAGVWHHARAHRFFSAARWSADTLGLGVCDLIVAWLDPAAPVCLVVDDSLFKRTGRKIFGSAGTMTRPPPAASAPRGATTGSWSGCWWRCRLWPTGRCACPSCAACGSPAGPAAASSTWPASWSGCCATATPTASSI